MFRLALHATMISEYVGLPGTENPEIKVYLYTATMTVFIQPLSATKNMLQRRYTPEIPDIQMCYNKSYKIGLTYNIFILASDGVILSRALSGQQIRVVLQNFDAQFGAILRTFSA